MPSNGRTLADGWPHPDLVLVPGDDRRCAAPRAKGVRCEVIRAVMLEDVLYLLHGL